MAVLLAFGVVAERNRRAWLVETGEEIDHDGPDGAAVVLGHRDSDPARVAIACADLAGLVELGGPVIAGAGIDLGEGFLSARLAGATGDRRDAVLAALRVLKVGGAWRLGERTATLVALFGVTATKPVGAAAEQAIGEGRWAPVVLASAAAEVLGPEQLVKVLELRAPDGADPVPDVVPSDLAANLRIVLEPYPRARRLDLVLDLWERVCAGQIAELRRDRLIASHDLTELDSLRERYRRFDESEMIKLVQDARGRAPTMADAIRFRPGWRNLWKYSVERLVQDAVAATVLLRAAVAVHELGVGAGIARVRDEIGAVSALFTKAQAKAGKARRTEGQPNTLGELPARPISHLREIDSWLRQQQPQGAAFERFVRVRLRTALVYAIVVQDRARTLLGHEIPREILPDTWDSESLRAWRAVAGYTASIAPEHWDCQPLVRRNRPALQARRAEDATAVERACDLYWLADLADAMARARGHAAAAAEGYYRVPEFDTNPARPQPDPLTPRSESVPLAVAGAAQLLALGANPPGRCRDWASLCAGLMTGGTVAAALAGEFEVPETVLANDGATLPGTQLRIQIARTAARLAEWSDYMGNCIAGPWYQGEAAEGRSILIALREENGVIAANAELRRTDRGWFVAQLAARFNNDPDPALRQAFRAWTATLRPEQPELEPVGAPAPLAPARTRRPAANPLRDVGPVLREAARKAMVESEPALRILAALAGDPDGDPKTLTALRRSTADRLTRLCAESLEARPASLPRLWAATGTRPLAAAIAALDPALPQRYPRLHTLPDDAPIPSKLLRALVKDPDIAVARSMDLVAQRIRAALGRMALQGDRAFTTALTRHPTPDLLCALVLMTTCATTHPAPVVAISDPRAVAIPGFPATTLADPDGPWQSAWPAAADLAPIPLDPGPDKQTFWHHIASHGLLLPTHLLPPGGWPTLWSRAHTP